MISHEDHFQLMQTATQIETGLSGFGDRADRQRAMGLLRGFTLLFDGTPVDEEYAQAWPSSWLAEARAGTLGDVRGVAEQLLLAPDDHALERMMRAISV